MLNIMKKMFKNFLVFLFAVFLIFMIGELFVVVFDKYKAFNELDLPRYRTADTVFHHRFVPNSKGRFATKEYKTIYHINSFGLRDREYTLKKPEGFYRIVMIGDSFVEGRGVNIENTFTKKLEKLLNENKESEKILGYEVINGGVASYSPILEYIAVKNKILRLNPDMVILCLDLSDIQDDYEYSKMAYFDNKDDLVGVNVDKTELIKPKKMFLVDFLERHSPFYLYIRRKIGKIFLKAMNKKERERPIYFGDIATDRLFMLRENVDIETQWKRTSSYIQHFRAA